MYSVYYSTIPLSIVNLLLSSCSHNAFGAGVQCVRAFVRSMRSVLAFNAFGAGVQCVRCWRSMRSGVRAFGACPRPRPRPSTGGRAGFTRSVALARLRSLASVRRLGSGRAFRCTKMPPLFGRGRGAVCSSSAILLFLCSVLHVAGCCIHRILLC